MKVAKLSGDLGIRTLDLQADISELADRVTQQARTIEAISGMTAQNTTTPAMPASPASRTPSLLASSQTLPAIEAALARRSSSRPDADYSHLAARHDALRAEVLVALQDLSKVSDAVNLDR